MYVVFPPLVLVTNPPPPDMYGAYCALAAHAHKVEMAKSGTSRGHFMRMREHMLMRLESRGERIGVSGERLVNVSGLSFWIPCPCTIAPGRLQQISDNFLTHD
jgi:hypothetical protein